jgi:hypothetical protein
MAAGAVGFFDNENVRAALWPQLLTARTETDPLVKAEPMVSEIDVVPCPDEIVVLAGPVHK